MGDRSKRPVANASWRVSRRTQAERNAPEHQRPWVRDEWGGVVDDALLCAIVLQVPMREGQRLARLSKQLRRIAPRCLETQLELCPEQALAFLDAMRGKNVFLTGGAGVGKSHTLQTIKQHLGQDEFVTTASTGCAAAIIGAMTFHSCCGIGIGTAPVYVYVNKIKKENRYVFNRLRGMKTLIIDEVGMLDGHLFDKAGEVVGAVRRDYGGEYQHLGENARATRPFQGLQLIVCGDFMQLPPVKVKECGWIFRSKAWAFLNLRNHVLTRIHRQGSDPVFANVLARMRVGNGTDDDLKYLINNCAGESTPEPADPSVDEPDALRLFARNKPADEHNWGRFCETVHQMTGHPFWMANDTIPAGMGPFRSFRNVPYPICALDTADVPDAVRRRIEDCPAPRLLWLCRGARVMCLKNLTPELVNGSVGTVVEITKEMEPPPLQRRVKWVSVVVRFDGMLNGDSFHHTFHTYHEDLPDDVKAANRFSIHDDKHKEIACRIQMPLRHAWACSIHKSQGMSLERVVIDFEGCFEDGQAYTALSRVRTLAGAWLVNLTRRHLRMASVAAKRWYAMLDVQQIN